MGTRYRFYEGPEPYSGQQWVGVDLHRRRSVVVRLTDTGERLDAVQVTNGPDVFGPLVDKAGPGAEVVVEATNGWYWAVDALQAAGANVHLAHPLGMTGLKNRRYKDDVKDAHDAADVLRLGSLPEAWIAPAAVRELRELVRYRHKLVQLRSGLKAQVHGVLAKVGLPVTAADLFGVSARRWLDNVPLPAAYATRIGSLLGLIDQFDDQEARFTGMIADQLHSHAGYRVIQTIPGIGPTLAAIFVAEIGDVHRFSNPAKLCSWAGLTPSRYESDTKAHNGHITKQGSELIRWAAVESIQRTTTNKIAVDRAAIEDRRGKNVAKVATARKQLTHVYYGLRDGHIRALARDKAAA